MLNWRGLFFVSPETDNSASPLALHNNHTRKIGNGIAVNVFTLPACLFGEVVKAQIVALFHQRLQLCFQGSQFTFVVPRNFKCEAQRVAPGVYKVNELEKQQQVHIGIVLYLFGGHLGYT
ncbi:hypothetical protein [Teredinibacter turnerae]|uniref:hypothetical protein n=1 Tax=Teredinibacter turnerae TaxID=2426 RepID=UPI000381985C|nr:hypothetical protein [Teredinibacter turnerae]